MARGGPRGPRGAGMQRATKTARRVWPYVMLAWERWQSLSPQEKERYKKHAREFADRARKVLGSRRGRGPR